MFSGHAGAISWDTISRDDRTLATSADGTVRLWDIESEQAVGAPLPGLPGHAVIGLPHAGRQRRDRRLRHRPGIPLGHPTASLIRQACGIAGRTLTRAEWDEFLPGRGYEPACTD